MPRQPSSPRRPLAAVLAAALATALTLVASPPLLAVDPPRRLVHERPPTALVRGRTDAAIGKVAAPGALPPAIDTAAGRIDAPTARGAGEAGGDDGAPLYPAPPAPGSTPPPRIRPDAATGKEGALHYRVVFDPSVAPFKRDLAFDRAEVDGSLSMSGAGLRTVRVVGTAGRPGHELFWGHVALELVQGRRTPLPSVAPTSQVLGIAADPPVALDIARDAAGNFSVSAKRSGRVELRYLMDAPSSYFSTPLAAGALDDAAEVTPLAPALQRALAALWPALGVSPAHDRKANVEALTRWFRSFVPGPGPDPRSPLGPALVSALVRGQRGICRHRAHGFVLMAWSLGIPAHYVMNDAHAFVEVRVRRADGAGRWLRIDLGGGAESLELHGADDHHLHRPLYPDSLPRPASFLAAAGGQRLGEAAGANDAPDGGGSWAGAQKLVGADGFKDADAAKAGARRGRPDGAVVGAAGGSPGADGQRDGDGQAPLPAKDWLAARAAALAAPRQPPPRAAGVGGAGAGADAPGRLATSIVLHSAAPVAYVGETLKVRGGLELPEGVRSAGLPIEVWLIDPSDAHEGVLVGHAVTSAGGAFAAKVAMPRDARLGVWDLVVRFAGDARLAPSFSRD